MARIPLVDHHDPNVDPTARALLQAAEDAQPDVGVLNVHKALANHPAALQKFMEFAQVVYFDNSMPDAKTRELPYLTSAVANNCFYWTPTHLVLGRASGLTDEQMSHLLDDPLPEGMFTPAEEAIIVYARTSTWFQPITDEIWDNLRAHFTEKQCMEISFTVGLDQLVSRFHATVQTDVDAVTTDQLTGSCPVALPPPPGPTPP